MALKKVKVTDYKRPVAVATRQIVNHHQTVPQPQSPLKVVTNHQLNIQTTNLDNESFALNWLRNTYEVANGTIKPQPYRVTDMYAEYVKFCCRSGRRNVIATQLFHQMIKKAFMMLNVLASSTHVDGLIIKATPKAPGQLASPILKAHLSTPPRAQALSTPPPPSTVQHTTSASLPATTTTSTLIKSLLANKLRNTANTAALAATAATNKILESQTPPPTQQAAIASKSTPASTPKTVNSTVNAFASHIVSNTPISQNQIINSPSIATIAPKTLTSNATPSFIVNNNCINVSTPHASHANAVSLNTTNIQATTTTSTANNQPMSFIHSSPHMSNAQGQAPQQFILVRTMIGGQQQQGLIGYPTGTGQIRLMLPSNMIQQRPLATNIVNGITTNGNQQLVSSPSAPLSVTNNSSSNDILLKAVLGSGIANDNPSSPPAASRASAAKSSPLLNVLLDRGKLPSEFSTGLTNANSHVSTVSTVTVNNSMPITSMAPQTKMYILTTKAGVPIKTISGLPQTTQIGQFQNQTYAFTQTNTPTLAAGDVKPSINKGKELVVQNHISANIIQNHNPPLTNGELSSVEGQKKSLQITTSDLSPIKDIQKAVDDATRLISKRSSQDDAAGPDVKKVKADTSIPATNGITATVALKATPSPIVNNKPPAAPASIAASTGMDAGKRTALNAPSTSIVPRPLEYICEWQQCKR